jgi:preprotein translocase subunit Sec63
MEQSDLDHALEVFGLSLPITRELLDRKHRELLHTWHPPRYANLTNNPRKYMQMYKKAEAMTREIEAAYKLLGDWLSSKS